MLAAAVIGVSISSDYSADGQPPRAVYSSHDRANLTADHIYAKTTGVRTDTTTTKVRTTTPKVRTTG